MTEIDELTHRAVAWHVARFPEAFPERVALKICEEAGEVGKAVNGRHPDTIDGDVLMECADVLLSMLVLLGRWWPDGDLLAVVACKLDVLTDPLGGHPSGIQP